MSQELFTEMREALERGESRVMVTVAGTRGSTPRKVGARMLLRPDGSFVGTIGGGCGEAEVWQEAMEVLKWGAPSCLTVDLTEDPEAEDRICGGQMDVFIEALGPKGAEAKV